VADLLKDSDSEEEEDELKSQKTTASKASRKEARAARNRTRKEGLAWLQENDDENPLDLLDPMAIKSVLAKKPLTQDQIEKRRLKELNSKTKNRGFKMNTDGKLMIDDDDDDDEEQKDDGKSKATSRKSSAKGRKKNDEIEEMMDTLSIGKKSTAAAKSTVKRRLDEDSDDLDETDVKSKFSYKSGGTGIHRSLDKGATNNQRSKTKEFGSEYRSKVREKCEWGTNLPQIN
jgi:hypothetical protein